LKLFGRLYYTSIENFQYLADCFDTRGGKLLFKEKIIRVDLRELIVLFFKF